MGLARPNLKKQKKRKRCRYERKHSLSLVHADWLDYDGTQVIAYKDDTSRKIERWFQEYRRHRWRFDTAYAFAEWYNNRVHGALDLEYFETPNDVFIRKMRCENTLGMFFEWSEREVSL